MEVRPRMMDDCRLIHNNLDEYDAKKKRDASVMRRGFNNLVLCFWDAANIVRGRGSWWTLVLLPCLTLCFWLLVCLVTHDFGAQLSFEERLRQEHIREILEPSQSSPDVNGLLSVERVEEILLDPDEKVHVFMLMPYLDLNPLASTVYLRSLQWLTTMSSVRVVLHAITNEDSKQYLDMIMAKVNESANCEIEVEVFSIEKLLNEAASKICPKLTLSQDYCDVIVGTATPLLLPTLMPNLDHAIFITPNITFQDDVGRLYLELQSKLMSSDSSKSILMSPEQTPLYMRNFAGWQRRHAATRWGRPPPEGRPGYNADLILMNLDKLRKVDFVSRLSEHRMRRLASQYAYSLSDEHRPSLGDLLNLLAIEDQDNLIGNLGCEWNRNPTDNINAGDTLYRAFNVCDEPVVRAWNGKYSDVYRTQGSSVVRVQVDQRHEDL